jgi:hypothetical protein
MDLARLARVDRPETMQQYAPFPHELADLVAELEYRPGWKFTLEDIERDRPGEHSGAAGGLTLVGITGTSSWSSEDGPSYEGAMDAYHPDQPRPVYFYFPVPAATFDYQSWRRWLFARLEDVERHEAMEYFQIAGERPLSPNHGPGRDPYIVWDGATDEQRRTSFRGQVKPA